jgi:hypothetical protein
MVSDINQLQKSNRKSTKREEEIIEELSESNLKTIIFIAAISSILQFPFLKNRLKDSVPFLSNDYYYAAFSGILVFASTYFLMKFLK